MAGALGSGPGGRGGGQQRVGGNGEAIAGWRRGPGHHAGGVKRQGRSAEAVMAQEGQSPLRLGRVVHHSAIDRGEPHAERGLRGGGSGGGQPSGEGAGKIVGAWVGWRSAGRSCGDEVEHGGWGGDGAGAEG